MKRFNSLLIVFVSYVIALLAGYFSISFIPNYHILTQVLFADFIATIIIYFSSVIFRNSSIYDPYWSVIPVFILIYFFSFQSLKLFNISMILMCFNVLFWSFRLTSNWIKNWSGLSSEDWRYIDMRKYSGKYFELSNFFGIHLFPTLIVYVCCLPMYFVSISNIDSSIFSILGFCIAFIGVLYEIISDYQLYCFRKDTNKKSNIIDTGIWKYSRHPNYWGEILFWWGLYFYIVDISPYYMIFAPISMTLMFVYVIIPWIEAKILRTRPEYKKYQQETNFLIPETAFIKKIIHF